MKNDYCIKGAITEIYIVRRNGDKYTCLIDTDDLDKVLTSGNGNLNVMVFKSSNTISVRFSNQINLLNFIFDKDRRTYKYKFIDGNSVNMCKANVVCSDPNYNLDISGLRVGMFTVVRKTNLTTNNGYPIWECLCDCGRSDNIGVYNLLCDGVKHCGCKTEGANHRNFTGFKELTGSYFASIQRGAVRRNISCSISKEYIYNLFLEQQGVCILSGLPIVLGARKQKYPEKQTASLDRIDSSLGYEEGNVQWVHKDINAIKQYYQEDYFVYLCTQVVEHSRKSNLCLT